MVRTAKGELKVYKLLKFRRSNQGTCINQKPIVKAGEKVKAGQVIADGPSTDQGELALGKNLLVAFMPWEGHNYEDAIVLSERLVKDDVLTSIHIEEHEVDARDTKLGPEEITRDIPNVSEEILKDLDERGIVRIGAEVNPGDYLVGKVTPKGETELTPGGAPAAGDLRGEGAGGPRHLAQDAPRRLGQGDRRAGVLPRRRRRARARGERAGPGVRGPEAEDLRRRQAGRAPRQQGRHRQDPARGRHAVPARRDPGRHRAEPARRAEPDEPRPGPRGAPRVGGPGRLRGRRARNGGGGTTDGQPELAGKDWGAEAMFVASPVFDGAREGDILGALGSAHSEVDGVQLVNEVGKAMLFDGRSGEPYDVPVTVGYVYILKLLHLVDDKIHARSTGPYSMITQQPLGGKAQFGGQRFGEMEVWALEAYGAAYALQELLTIKSDDVLGRVKVYEAIVKGENIPEPGIPESFKVLIKEMQSLCLNVEVLSAEGKEIEMRETDEDVFRAAEELGIDLSRREPAGADFD